MENDGKCFLFKTCTWILSQFSVRCEIWGFENLDTIDRENLKFLKTIFNLRSKTQKFILYGEKALSFAYKYFHKNILTKTC